MNVKVVKAEVPGSNASKKLKRYVKTGVNGKRVFKLQEKSV